MDQLCKKSFSFLFVLEDDIWITSELYLSEMEVQMEQNHLVLIKLFWGNNAEIFKGKITSLTQSLDNIAPRISLLPLAVLRLLFYNRFKLSSILHRLGIIGEGIKFQMPFYDLYGVAACIFNKKYWLHLWENDSGGIDEPAQLLKAVGWFRTNNSKYAKSSSQKADTSFISSVSNRPYKNISFDMFCFNHYLNEAWLNDQLDAMSGFPGDFINESIKTILDQAADPRCTYELWVQWTHCFKEQYRNIGAVIE